MNYIHRNCRSLASLTRRVGILLARPAVTAITQPDEPPHWTAPPLLPVPARTITTSEPRAGVRPQSRRKSRHTKMAPAWLPHTIQLCIRCGEKPAGFWVSHAGGKTIRRPWCLCCCQGLDQGCCDIIPFDS